MFVVVDLDGTQFIDSWLAVRLLFNERLFRPGERATRYQRFRQQVAQHDRRWTEFFLPGIYKSAKMTAADYDAVPRFRFVEEPPIALVRRAGMVLVGLLLPTLLIGALGLGALKKYSLYVRFRGAVLTCL